jgi:glycosyltransferase involved in cell wall biosynthesis
MTNSPVFLKDISDSPRLNGGKRCNPNYDSPRPYISIITATYNAGGDIEKTILSIRNQLSSDIEWIIIDGGSQDDSLDQFRKYDEVIDLWISEPDSGIYDAWNKGLKFANGEWVLFLGAGDCFASENVLELTMSNLRSFSTSITFAYGGIYLVSHNFKKLIKGKVDITKWDLGLPSLPPHPAVFHRIELFNDEEPFDKSYNIAGDTKFMLLHANHDCFRFMDLIVSCMEVGGISSRPESWLTIKEEKLRIRRELGIVPPPWYKRTQDIKLYIKPLIHKVLGKKTNRLLGLFRKQKDMNKKVVRNHF